MYKIILLTASLLFYTTLSALPLSKTTYLIQNMEDHAVLPRNYRTTLDPLPENGQNLPSPLGFAQLNASGSGQFSVKSLETLIESTPNGNITVIDLREEPHAMLNGMAITWYSHNNWTNEGLTREEIDADLFQRIEDLKKNPPNTIFKNKHAQHSIPITVEAVYTEQEAVENLGLGYLQLTARDHTRPSDESVDEFVAFVKTMDPDSWLHFHCSAGRGRTTTFMALFDMMRNADNVSLDDIVKRQELIGGLKLFHIPSKDDWQYEHVLARAQLVRHFYDYCREIPDFSISWSEWKAAMPLTQTTK